MVLGFLWRRELVFQWEQKGYKNRDFRGDVCVGAAAGHGMEVVPSARNPPSSQGAALSSARDGAPGALKPQQTQLLLQFPENLTHRSFCHLIEIIMK